MPALVVLLPSVGTFDVVRMPLDGSQDNKAHVRVTEQDLGAWFAAIEQRMPALALAHIGAQLMPARDGEAPGALAYATLRRKQTEKEP